MHVKLILNICQYIYLLILVMLILGVPPTHPNTHTHTHNGILKMFVKAYALLNLHRKRV